MRTLIRLAVELYPPKWRKRYATEFHALLDDIHPCFRDVCNVLGHALRMRAAEAAHSRLMLIAAATPFRVGVCVSIVAHAMLLSSVLLASWSYLPRLPLRAPAGPLPPPAPDAPAQIADPRVFPQLTTLYSSMPLHMPVPGSPVSTSINYGVGINFPTLPDAWATVQGRSPKRQVWPGQALESAIIRRALPEYPGGADRRSTGSVFVEYLVALDGSVAVLRTSGAAPFAGVARSAVQLWRYRPIRCEDGPCEVVSRLEVRFDGALAR